MDRPFRSTCHFVANRLVFLLLIALLIGCKDSSPTSQKAKNRARDQSSSEAQDILDRMRQTYKKATSYADNSLVVEHSIDKSLGRKVELIYQQLSLAFVRPNHIRLEYSTVAAEEEAIEYKIASNGRVMRSAASEVPLQVHELEAPRILSLENFVPEPLMRSDMLAVSLENLYPQLILLLEDPEQKIFPRAEKMRLLPENRIDNKSYFRVQLISPAGKRVLWIDKEDYHLRRMELPIQSQLEELDPGNKTRDLLVWIDFLNVSFDAEIDSNSFEIPIPEGGRRVRQFIQPPPAEPNKDDEESMAEYKELVRKYQDALESSTLPELGN